MVATLSTKTSANKINPVRSAFADVSVWKLILSSARIFWHIYRQQGLSGALRVFPIIWTIIYSVYGFSKFHQKEFERIKLSRLKGIDVEEIIVDGSDQEEYRHLGRWLCDRLHNLGPTFIKIGQTLSTRADLLPLSAMLELAKLQESVQPFPTDEAVKTIETDLGGSIAQFFQEFDYIPIAAASLAQAYKATLSDGKVVVVKVQRPNLAKIITADIQILESVAQELMRYPSLCRHTDWPGVNQEFKRTIFEEIDYIQEGKSADRFRQNFRNFPSIFIPHIIWRLTGRRVLTLEYVEGVRVDDIPAWRDMGILRDDITAIGAHFYLKQLLEDGFFHADPHPGNLRIMADGRVGIFDFGMVGHLSPSLKEHTINAFLHVIQRDYRALIDDFVGMGFLDASVNREALNQDLAPIVDQRFSEGMSHLRFRQILFDFSEVCWRYPFRLPTEFTYVMRALLTLEGVALIINPQFNFVDTALPYAQRLILKNNGGLGQAIFKEVFSDGRFNSQAAVNLFKAATKLSQAP
jgi:predicted unusual protein kinase regulating ubiquinone biosynthesis (AarF/ABC1/UbiB family)